MSASSSSESSIAEEESLSMEETRPKDIAPLEQTQTDEYAEASAAEDATHPSTAATQPADPPSDQEYSQDDDAFEYESDYTSDVVEQSSELQPSTVEAEARPATEPSLTPENAVTPSPPPPPAPWLHLGILDPSNTTSGNDAAEAAALSRTEANPGVALLLARLHRHQRGSATGQKTTAPRTMTALDGLAAASPMQAATVYSLLAHVRSIPVPKNRPHWSMQPDRLPVAPPPRPVKPSRLEMLQIELDRRAASASSHEQHAADDQENRLPLPPPRIDPTAPSLNTCFPSDSPVLQLATAQAKMHAALESMRCHRFEGTYRMPPQDDRPIDFGLGLMHDAGDPSSATYGAFERASGDPVHRHAFKRQANEPARDVWLDPLLNRLEAHRASILANPEPVLEAFAEQEFRTGLVQSHTLTTQIEMLRASMRTHEPRHSFPS